MTAIELAKTLDMPREKWLQKRRQGIGGSDASVILGLNPWKTQMDLWLEKTGEFTEDEDNEKMYWGRILEDIIAQEFSIRAGLKVRRKNAILQHKQHPFMLANVDRLVIGQKAGVECKNIGIRSAEHWEMGVPEYYQAQVQHYMAVTGYPVWYVAVLIGGQEFRYYKLTMDEQFIHELIQAEAEFWKLVETRTPPPLDGSKASTELVKRMYPEAEQGKEIELPFEAFELIQQYEQACEEEKQIQLKKDEAANKLKNMLGTAERGSIHGRQVIWQNTVSKRLNTKALEKAHPEIYDEFLKESVYRRFSIK